jgi:antitoxin MazE
MAVMIKKWGNSLAIRIPKALARDAHLESGSVVSLSVCGGAIIVEPANNRKYELGDLLKVVSRKNIHRSVRTGSAVGSEML